MPPHEMAKEAQVVFLALSAPKDVQHIVLDESTGLLPQMKSGTTIVDHTTSTPKLAETIAEKALKKGVYSLDAPVSGGDIGAKAGTLLIMTGGVK